MDGLLPARPCRTLSRDRGERPGVTDRWLDGSTFHLLLLDVLGTHCWQGPGPELPEGPPSHSLLPGNVSLFQGPLHRWGL